MNRLEEINQLATENTIKALRKMTGKPVDAKLSNLKEMDISEVSNILPSDDLCAGIYMDIAGDIKGRLLILFSKQVSFNLCDTLFDRPLGQTVQLDELDKEALKEVSNIIGGNYLSILSNILQAKMLHQVPVFGFGLAPALLEQIIAPLLQKPKKIFIIELEIIFPQDVFKGYTFFFFIPLAHKAIMDILNSPQSTDDSPQ